MRTGSILTLFAAAALALVSLASCSDDESATGGAGGAGTGSGTTVSSSSGNGSTSSGAGGGGGSTGSGLSGRCPSDITSDAEVMQILPQATVDIAMPQQAGAVIDVAEGGDLQAAIDGAAAGDTIRIAAGATFQGPFTLPAFDGDGVVIIRTGADDAALPPEGTRIAPSFAAQMPKLLASAGNEPAIRVAAGARGWRLVGIEMTTNNYVTALVDIGSAAQSLAEMPQDIVLDRVYLHGHPIEGTRRGIALNGGATAVIDSYLSDFKEAGADSQAIGGWSGSGPYLIANNHLEGAGENFILGGADPSIADLVPTDVTFCHNLVTKPLGWLDEAWSVKNLFELKNARRVLVAGNVFENNWLDAQVGFAILFTVRNQDGTAPQSTVEDVTFTRNVVRHVASGINVLASDDNNPSQVADRIVVTDNLITDLDTKALGGDGRAMQVTYGGGTGGTVKLAHNTVTDAGNAFLVFGDSAPVLNDLLFTDNIAAHGDYGAFGSGQGEGTAALDFFFTSYTFAGNVIFDGGAAGQYPAGNSFAADLAAVGFVDAANGDYHLSASSSYVGTATDGSDPGADMDAIAAAIAGVE